MKYTSKEFASLGNVTKKTLRHYDKINLLSPSSVDTNGYWYYDDKDLDKLQLIRNLQVLGFNLNEIKINIDNDFQLLKESIESKKLYVDEQIIQLKLAKRLLEKIENKLDLAPISAINQSLEEEHLEWYKRNLTTDEYDLVLKMVNSNESEVEHEKMIIYLREFKEAYSKSNTVGMMNSIISIKKIFFKYDLKDDTINTLMRHFLQSNLEGPLSSRILSIAEVAKFTEILTKDIKNSPQG